MKKSNEEKLKKCLTKREEMQSKSLQYNKHRKKKHKKYPIDSIK